jgi:hypothetical protein
MTSLTREFIISFFPNLYEYNLVSGGSNIEDDPFVKIMRCMNVEQSDASNSEEPVMNHSLQFVRPVMSQDATHGQDGFKQNLHCSNFN